MFNFAKCNLNKRVMAAPAGNEFWKLRSKHGRDKLFKTPNLLWEAACEYFQWCNDNPLIEIDYRGSNPPVEVKLPRMRAMTLEGLCFYLHVNKTYFNDFDDSLKNKSDKESKDFSEILTRIREVIYRQKFEGASAGILNANIIARDLGLSEKAQIQQNNTIEYVNVSKQFPDE